LEEDLSIYWDNVVELIYSLDHLTLATSTLVHECLVNDIEFPVTSVHDERQIITSVLVLVKHISRAVVCNENRWLLVCEVQKPSAKFFFVREKYNL
jgi:hypothetical protein